MKWTSAHRLAARTSLLEKNVLSSIFTGFSRRVGTLPSRRWYSLCSACYV